MKLEANQVSTEWFGLGLQGSSEGNNQVALQGKFFKDLQGKFFKVVLLVLLAPNGKNWFAATRLGDRSLKLRSRQRWPAELTTLPSREEPARSGGGAGVGITCCVDSISGGES